MMIPEKSFAGRDSDQLASTTSSHIHTYTFWLVWYETFIRLAVMAFI